MKRYLSVLVKKSQSEDEYKIKNHPILKQRIRITALFGGITALFLSLMGCMSTNDFSPVSFSNKSVEALNSHDTSPASEEIAKEAADDSEIQMNQEDSGWIDPANMDQTKMVYTVNVSMETRDYEKTWSGVRADIEKAGGFITAENLSNHSYYDNPSAHERSLADESSLGQDIYYGSYTLRIPAKNLDSFLNEIDNDGNVVSLSKNADNIYKRYSQTEEQIKFLEKQSDRLKELLSQAKDLSEIIDIEQKQMEVDQQLKDYREQLSSMDMDVEYSTVYLNIEKVEVLSSPKESFIDNLTFALKNTWSYMLLGLQNLLIFLIYLFPWIVVIGLLLWLIRKFYWKKKHIGNKDHHFKKFRNKEMSDQEFKNQNLPELKNHQDDQNKQKDSDQSDSSAREE